MHHARLRLVIMLNLKGDHTYTNTYTNTNNLNGPVIDHAPKSQGDHALSTQDNLPPFDHFVHSRVIINLKLIVGVFARRFPCISECTFFTYGVHHHFKN